MSLQDRLQELPQLVAERLASMREPAVALPETSWADACGLGFSLEDWGTPVFGHDGGTIGQVAKLRILPAHDLALVLFANGGDLSGLSVSAFGAAVRELTGVSMPVNEPPSPIAASPADLERFVGRYARTSVATDVDLGDDGRLRYRTRTLRGPLRKTPGISGTLEPAEDGRLLARIDGRDGAPEIMKALNVDAEGRPRYLFAGLRATPRIG